MRATGTKSQENGVVLFHPSTAPFVQQAALALYDAGLLSRFVTTLRENRDSKVQEFACKLSAFFGFDLRRQLGKRAVTSVPDDVILDWPIRESLRTFASKLDSKGILTDKIWEWAEVGFDRWVGSHCLTGARAVYGYEHACADSFESASKCGLKCIYDVQAPEHDFTHAIINREIEKYPATNSEYQKYILQHQQRRTERRRREWEQANLVIAASEFTRASYEKAGLDVEKVAVIPYGAPPVHSNATEGGSPVSEKCKFLWAGTFNIRKGAPYVLDAWRSLPASANCALQVYGAQKLPEQMLRSLPGSIFISSGIPRTELTNAYLASDALIFPTLCDGFGMVVTEALAHGLPVITTERAGASRFIRHEENGLIIAPESSSAIRDAILWCLDQREKLKEMRVAATRSAASWQWTDYREQLAATVAEKIF